MKRTLTPIKSTLLASALFASSLAFFQGCNDSDSDDEVVTEQAPAGPTLTQPIVTPPEPRVALVPNSFRSTCVEKELLDMTSTARAITFNADGSFQKRDEFFLGDDCGDKPYLAVEVMGTFKDGGKDPSGTNHSVIDFSINEAYVTPLHETLLITLNTSGYCGKSDWVVGEKVALDNLSCDVFKTKRGTIIADLYVIEGESVYFSDAFTYDTAPTTTRPTSVDRDYTYRVPVQEE